MVVAEREAMRFVELAYYFTTYTLMSMALVVSFGRAWVLRKEAERAHCLLMLSFSLLLLAATIGNAAPWLPPLWADTLSYLGMAAVCLAVYAVPALSASLSSQALSRPAPAWGRSVRASVALIAFLAVSVGWTRPWRIVAILSAYVLLVAAVVAAILGRTKRGMPRMPVDVYWKKLGKVMVRGSAVYIPIFIALDLLLPILRPPKARIPIYPLFFAIWGGTVIWLTLEDILRRPLPEAPTPIATALNDQRMAALGLSKREREAARLIASGLSYKEIAARMFVSEATVKTHISRIYSKTGASSKVDAVNRLIGP
jgi:DNA-binding CsgD family transcriptional regulator